MQAHWGILVKTEKVPITSKLDDECMEVHHIIVSAFVNAWKFPLQKVRKCSLTKNWLGDYVGLLTMCTLEK